MAKARREHDIRSATDTDREIDRVDERIDEQTATRGMVEWFPGDLSMVPNTHHPCDGRAIDRRVNKTLFQLFGTKYGTGDGQATFNLPDLTDRSPRPLFEYEIGVTKDTGDLWIDRRRIYRKVYAVAAFPNATFIGVSIDDSLFQDMVRLWARADDGTVQRMIPNSTDNARIVTNAIRIETTLDLSTYSGHIVLEYTRNEEPAADRSILLLIPCVRKG